MTRDAPTTAAAAAPAAALAWKNVWVDTVGPLAAVVGASLVTALVEGVRERALVRRFVPSHVRRRRPDTLTEVATVMFVDLRGSTALAEKIGPVAAQELLSHMLSRLSDDVARHGGEVERTLGDGLLAVFREHGRVSHAVRGVEATLTLRNTVSRMSREWKQRHDVEAEVTIAVETGMISGAVIRSAEREEWSSFGPTVNLARRLQEQCALLGVPVLLGPTARALVQPRFETVFLGTPHLKGVAEPTPVYALKGAVREPAGGAEQ